MIDQRPGQKIFTVPGPGWGVRVIQPAAMEEYYRKVLSYGPIAYWPLWDAFGSGVAEELVNSPAQDGAHTAVTCGQPGIGDGQTSCWYNGIGGAGGSFTNIFTPVFQGAFNPLEGTAIAWARVNGAGVWTDGITRWILRLYADANNRIELYRHAVNNRLTWLYVAGGVFSFRSVNGLAMLDFFHMAITWSATADEVWIYLNGIPQGPVINGLGAWVGVLDPIRTVIGAGTTVPANVWHGWEQHVPVFDYAIPPAGILDLATV